VPESRERPNVPSQADAPVVWDPQLRRFVDAPVDGAPTPAPAAAARKQYYVGADQSGRTLPPREAPPREPTKPTPAPQTATPPPPRRRSRSRRPWIAAAILVPIVLVLLAVLWAAWKFDQIDRVAVGDLLDHGGSGTNYLIVGSDSRAGVDPNDPNAGAIIGEGAPGGQRSDTILVLRVEGGESRMLSIPRDLFVTIAETGEESRINAAYNGGPGRLIKTVQDNLGIPINRYIEVDFVTFAGLVDAIGGVTINFEHPATDANSGLNVQQAGPVELDGTQALAYVRSRHYTETIDGQQVTDPTGDLGRVVRQQAFLRTVLGKAGGSRNPITLMKIANAVSGGLRIDDDMSFFDAVKFAWRMKSLEPESVPLPVEPFTTSGGAAVLRMKDDAPAVLDEFR
jgi:LCP family protein required for cell wall assembly